MMDDMQSRLEEIKKLCVLEGVDSESIEIEFEKYIGQQPSLDAAGNFSNFPERAKKEFLRDLLIMHLGINEILCYDDDLTKYRMRFDRLYKILGSYWVSGS